MKSGNCAIGSLGDLVVVQFDYHTTVILNEAVLQAE
jgi:hypothetical protein